MDVELGGLTVIVGPSNSGKSAVLRALKAVVRNVNSPSAVRAGKSLFTAEVSFGATQVSIERGKSQSTYRVSLPNETEEVFTKAGRTVPEEVQQILALPLPDGPDLTFSSQIDPPFLLSETGTTAAKILGDLTNVSKLHAASKEANRRRLEFTKLQKIRKDDAVGCAVRLRDEFSDLPSQVERVKKAKDLLSSVQAKARQGEKLAEVLDTLDVLDAAEEDLRVRLEELPEPADIENLAEAAGTLVAQRHALLDVISTLATLASQEDVLTKEMKAALSEDYEAAQQYNTVLKEAGKCPTCNQEIAA